jgi:hypothetical protein
MITFSNIPSNIFLWDILKHTLENVAYYLQGFSLLVRLFKLCQNLIPDSFVTLYKNSFKQTNKIP